MLTRIVSLVSVAVGMFSCGYLVRQFNTPVSEYLSPIKSKCEDVYGGDNSKKMCGEVYKVNPNCEPLDVSGDGKGNVLIVYVCDR